MYIAGRTTKTHQFRRERRSAFPTQIDVYQSQRTTSNLGYFRKKLKPSRFHRRSILRMTIGNLLTDRFYTQISEFSGSCEFFHKKRLDRCLYLLYYRASLILDEGRIVCTV